MTHAGAPSAGAAGFQIRPAREEDLDVIAGFEIEIARASFGSEAIEDPALHRKRVAGALGKPGEVTLVAVAAGAPGAPAVPVGWAWLSESLGDVELLGAVVVLAAIGLAQTAR